MKQIKQIAFMIITIFMVMGAAKTSAQTMMNLEDIDYYLDSFQTNHTVYYSQELQGSYDGERGTWIAQINHSTLPQLELTVPEIDNNGYETIYDYESGSPLYGFLIFVYDQNNDHCYVYDHGIFFPFLGTSLEYDGTGIMQYTGGTEPNEEEDPDYYYIPDAYFQCGDIFDLTMSSGFTTIRLVIYE